MLRRPINHWETSIDKQPFRFGMLSVLHQSIVLVHNSSPIKKITEPALTKISFTNRTNSVFKMSWCKWFFSFFFYGCNDTVHFNANNLYNQYHVISFSSTWSSCFADSGREIQKKIYCMSKKHAITTKKQTKTCGLHMMSRKVH